MVSTLSVMAASLLLGQTGPTPVTPTQAPAAKTYVYSNGTLVPADGPKATVVSEAPAEGRRPLFSRIQGWFGKRNSTPSAPPATTTFPSETAPPPVLGPTLAPGKTPTQPTSAPASDLPRKMPTSFSAPAKTTDRISPASLQGLPTPARSPILPANASRIGRDEKFQWVTGQLETEKGQYVLYYATPETVDPHHGRILISPQKVDLRQFHSGDLVSVRGTLVQGHGSATYQLTSADLIEKAKR